jgi:uncharacterized protein (TIGR02996 family)
MSDERGLLRAILAEPDDDTPRLVYADWLQENDRAEEAELVRVQCGLEASPPDHPDYQEWLAREEELKLWLSAHVPGPRVALRAGLKVEDGPQWWKWTRRGFPRFLEFEVNTSTDRVTMRELAKALERAFAVLPTRWLVLRFITVEQLAELLRQPIVAALDHITIQLSATDDPQDEAARLVADCPHWRDLRGMTLVFALGDESAAVLARSERLSGLRSLSTSHCGWCTAAGVRSLGGAGWFRGLQSLDLSELDADAFEALCRLDPFPELHTLELHDSIFPTAAWRAFARSKAFPRLARLVSHTGMAEGQAEALAGANGLRLTELSLAISAIGNAGAAALVRAPWFGSLQSLRLAFNLLTPAGFEAIAGNRSLTGLKHLDLSYNVPGVRGLRALADNPALRGLTSLALKGGEEFNDYNRGLDQTHFHDFLARLDMPNLRQLVLSGRPVGGKSARLFAGEKFGSLTRLELDSCKLTAAAVAELVTAPALQNLIELNLEGNNLRDGVKPLADRANLPRLSSCNLKRNRVAEPLAKLLLRRPGVELGAVTQRGAPGPMA